MFTARTPIREARSEFNWQTRRLEWVSCCNVRLSDQRELVMQGALRAPSREIRIFGFMERVFVDYDATA
jgi:hypothetical protein